MATEPGAAPCQECGALLDESCGIYLGGSCADPRRSAARGLDAIRAAFENVPPAPKVDRVVVHDDRALTMFERRAPASSLAAVDSTLPPALVGIPVTFDENVDVGVIEFRKGDELVRRFHLPELRA